MPPDLAQIRARQQAAAAAETDARVQARALRWAVGVRMDELVAGDAWGTYRAHLEALVRTLDAEREALVERLADPATVGDDLVRFKAALQANAAERRAYQTAIQLPEALRAQTKDLTAAAESA